MLTTFVDTGAFCAMSDRSDHYHEVAVRQFAELLQEKSRLVITNFIVDESYTWIRYRLGHGPAMTFLDRIREAEKATPFEVATVTRRLEERATEILRRFSDQTISYTDATSLALIEERSVPRAFSFDRHFHLVRTQVIPGITR